MLLIGVVGLVRFGVSEPEAPMVLDTTDYVSD